MPSPVKAVVCGLYGGGVNVNPVEGGSGWPCPTSLPLRVQDYNAIVVPREMLAELSKTTNFLLDITPNMIIAGPVKDVKDKIRSLLKEIENETKTN